MYFQICELDDKSRLSDLMQIKGLQFISEKDLMRGDILQPVLRFEALGLSLFHPGKAGFGSTRVDFNDPRLLRRVDTSQRRGGLPKAAGLDRMNAPTVLDATAGLGIDAFTLAAMGCTVTMAEKSPVMQALLQDGLNRARVSDSPRVRDAAGRLSLSREDAGTLMNRILAGEGEAPQVIYLDPMFPLREKRALVKKDMALLQDLLPANDDVDSLLALARRTALKRVVLKRPGRRTKVAAEPADFQVAGKACHFLVYLSGR